MLSCFLPYVQSLWPLCQQDRSRGLEDRPYLAEAHSTAPRRPATPLQKQVFCSAGVMWIGARPRLLLSNGSTTEAELRLPPLYQERERWFLQQTTLVVTQGWVLNVQESPVGIYFNNVLDFKMMFFLTEKYLLKENHYQEKKKWSEIWLHQFNVFTLEYCSISVVFAKHGKPLKLDTSKYFMFLFWKCWRSRSYALEMSRRLRNFASKLILFRFHPSIVHISVETSWSILGCCIYIPGAAEGVSSGGGVSGRRRFFAATAGARCRSRLIAHCQICPAPRTSTIQGKRSLIFYISSLFWLMDLLSVRNNAKLCVDCTV